MIAMRLYIIDKTDDSESVKTFKDLVISLKVKNKT